MLRWKRLMPLEKMWDAPQGTRVLVLRDDSDEVGAVYKSVHQYYWASIPDWGDTSKWPSPSLESAMYECEYHVRKILGLPEPDQNARRFDL